jgi:putative transposase
VKLIAPVRLLPDSTQAMLLRATFERCNAACTWIAEKASEKGIRRQYDIHHAVYAETRRRFGLAAQATVRCISKVADSLKAGNDNAIRAFRPHAAQPYDERIFRLLPGDRVSIWTLTGRIVVPFACGKRQREMIARARGQADLMLVRGKWLLALTCDADASPTYTPIDVLGVDLGVVNLACDDLGNTYTGKHVETVRRRQHTRRRALQKKGTRSAKRALRRASGRQARFQRHTSHCISKAIVAVAQRDRCAIALEDLSGIRDRVQAPRRQRARLHNWAFHAERTLITYKAFRCGAPIVLVDPRNTSRECPSCGVIDKRNRKTRDDFVCIWCGLAGPADHIAGINIRSRGLIATGLVVPPVKGTTPSLLSVSLEESRPLQPTVHYAQASHKRTTTIMSAG